MRGGIAQVWAENELNAILSYTSTFATLAELLSSIEKTSEIPTERGWLMPNWHALKMTMA